MGVFIRKVACDFPKKLQILSVFSPRGSVFFFKNAKNGPYFSRKTLNFVSVFSKKFVACQHFSSKSVRHFPQNWSVFF